MARKTIPVYALITPRIMKGNAFRDYPREGHPTYDAHYAAVQRAVYDDWKSLPEAEFKAKYDAYIY